MNQFLARVSALLVLSSWYQSPLLCAAKSLNGRVMYAVMFDAGSSGTRCKVYKVTRPAPGRLLQVSDVEQLAVPSPSKIKPGLSSFGEDPAGVGAYLEKLIEAAKKVVPAEYRARTPVYVFATAGMRLLPYAKRNAVMKEVGLTLSDYEKSPFKYCKGNAKVITGTEEAIYDWVTVNFLLGVFSGQTDEDYGALDMGGASSQNSFDVKGTGTPSTVDLELGGKHHRIFAHSYLGYGEVEARKTLVEYIVKRTLKMDRNARVIYNPCYNSNYKTAITVEGRDFEMHGAFNFPLCSYAIRKVFFCRRGPLNKCPFKKQPRLSGKFYAFSLYNYAFRETNLTRQDGERVETGDILRVIKKFCARDLTKEELKNKYSVPRCVQLNLIYQTLTVGFKVKSDFELYVGGKLNGFDLNWALGAMLTSLDGLL